MMPTSRRVLPLLPALLGGGAGCSADPGVALQGALFDTPWPDEAAAPIAGASVTAFPDDDPDDVTTGGEQGQVGSGRYTIGFFPPGDLVHLRFDAGEGTLPTLIPAAVPDTGTEVDDGVFHAWSVPAVAAALGAEGDLPGAEAGVLLGRISNPAEREGDPVAVTSGGEEYAPVYADADGVPEPGRTGTSASGSFAFVDLPPGPAVLHTLEADLAVWIEAGAVTSVRGDLP